MRNINEKYIEETYNSNGVLTSAKLKIPDDFNFAYDIVDDIAENDPDRLALVWTEPGGTVKKFTFSDIKRYSDKTANYFKSLGIKKGDMVLVILKRHYQFWFVATALHKLGAVLVPATFMLQKHDIDYRVNAAGIKAVVCTTTGDVADAVDAAAPDCPTLKIKIAVGDAREGWFDYNSDLEAAPEGFERVPTKIDEPMIMYFSSGTSGYPKMVLHDYTYAVAHLVTAKHWHNVVEDGLHFSIADTGWGKAVWGKYYGQWIMESAVFVYDFDKFSAADILSKISQFGVTTLCCPPTMFRMFLLEGPEKYDLSKLTYATIAGEALNPDVFYGWKKATGLSLMEGFGQTETTLTIFNSRGMTPKPGSMGKPSPIYDVTIVDEDGKPVPTGVTGEIVVRCEPHPAGLLKCYYRDEEKTIAAMHDGLYHTGDTAWRDEDGYFWYVGRTDDIIKSSGYRIGPFEIESVLVEHEAVLECAVTGVPDPVRGQLVKATVVLADGYTPSEELKKELQNYVKKETAPYKYPRVIDFVDELPKTVNGKIRRVSIREKDKK